MFKPMNPPASSSSKGVAGSVPQTRMVQTPQLSTVLAGLLKQWLLKQHELQLAT